MSHSVRRARRECCRTGAKGALRLARVDGSRGADLSPIRLEEVQFNGTRLRAREPFVLVPELDDSGQLLCVRCEELGIDACAYTRADLEEEVTEEVEVLWRNYAQADDQQLTASAKALKNSLLATFEEVEGAA